MRKTCVSRIGRFLAAEHGPTSVEYAVMLALVVLACIGGVMSVGSTTKTLFTNANTSIQAAGS